MPSAIEICNVSKTYQKTPFERVSAIKKLSFDVPTGSIFGFVGPNGAGKSTLIKLAMGLIFPDEGRISFFERPSNIPEARSGVGYVPEQPILYEQLTGIEYMRFSCALYGMDGASSMKSIESCLEKVGLTDAGRRVIRTYSKGMQQRLAIAQAIVSEPDLVILDEPLSGLDPVGRIEIQDLLQELNSQGRTIFFSSHILHDVETICHEVALILKGELKYSGSPKEIEHIFKEVLGL